MAKVIQFSGRRIPDRSRTPLVKTGHPLDWGEGITVSLRYFLQMATLLACSQLVLGLVGYGVYQRFPWPGLLATLLLVWLIARIASVLRQEIIRARRNRKQVVPLAAALLVAFLWQLPGLLVLPLWAPAWAWSIWQGAVLPLAAVASRLAGAELSPLVWAWAAYGVEILLFAVIASWSTDPRAQVRRAQKIRRPAGGTDNVEWAPARRYTGPGRASRLAEAGEEAAEEPDRQSEGGSGPEA